MDFEEDKKRARNFTYREKQLLIEYVAANKRALFGSAGRPGHENVKVEERKRKCWERLGVLMVEHAQPQRGWKEYRKRWQSLKLAANRYKGQKDKTGGGPTPPYNSILELVLQTMAREAVVGIRCREREVNPLNEEEDILSSQESSQESSSPAPSVALIALRATTSSSIAPRTATSTTTSTPRASTSTSAASTSTSAASSPTFAASASTSVASAYASLSIVSMKTQIQNLSAQVAALQGKPSTLQKATEMRHLKLQEEFLQIEKAKLDLQRQQLDVSQKMLLALESIAAGGLFRSMQEQ